MDGTCNACGKSVLFIKEAVYDGFTKTGEQLKCSSCGALQAGEVEDLIKPAGTPSIFSDEDRSPKIDLFSEGENRIICRYCEHYVVNPFTQRCAHHDKEVEATDTCFDFSAAPEVDESEAGED